MLWGGAGGIQGYAGNFFPKRIISRRPFNFNQISAPAPPSFIRPWGTTLDRNLAVFFSIISLDPKEAKSAKKSKSIFSTDFNRLSP